MRKMGDVLKILLSVVLLSRLCWTQDYGTIPVKPTISSTYRIECKDDCEFHTEDSYYWCNTEKGWDYCSPVPDLTYTSDPCREGHFCDTHGYYYTWCWTESSWGYCSLPQNHDGSKIIVRQKRQPNTVEICSVHDKAKKRRTTLTAQPNSNVIADGNSWKKEMSDLIENWKNDKLPDQAKSELIKSKNLRIDLQGLLKRSNQNYYNLQIQINKKRGNNESTTLAQVIMPVDEDIPDRYVRRAFAESAKQRARVFIDVTSNNIPIRQGQNCD
ncbi:uncharacterized protein LOC124381483 isoform X1 [Silurus meridionalis]|uniref:uncharacterized protein LOC124381483 isoform X1 n=2 Tax=Silurus meridionalis TaxID=175797 RepID=UPI001EEA41F2|nr:uncharacterized protein LOC124381483 isoform X1 [Silurus meridionalis]